MGYRQDVSGLDELRRELKVIPDRILDQGERIVGKAMSNVKSGAVKRVRVERWAHLPHLPRAFSYDVKRTGMVIRGEAGADREKLQGGLDIYVDQGTPTNPPNHHWSRSFDEELPRFDKYAEDLLQRLIR